MVQLTVVRNGHDTSCPAKVNKDGRLGLAYVE